MSSDNFSELCIAQSILNTSDLVYRIIFPKTPGFSA